MAVTSKTTTDSKLLWIPETWIL